MESTDIALQTIQTEVIGLGIDTTYKVETAEQAQVANFQLGEVKSLTKRLTELKRTELEPHATAEKEIRAKFQPAELMLLEVERVAKKALVGFQQAERQRIAAQEAQRRAALEAEQAKNRQAAEDIRTKAEAKAADLRAAGKDAKADSVLAQADIKAGAKETTAALVAANASVPAVQPTKLAGVSNRSTWTGEVTDTRAFLDWLVSSVEANSLDADDLLSFKTAGLNRLATLFKRPGIPGFKVVENVSIARRAA